MENTALKDDSEMVEVHDQEMAEFFREIEKEFKPEEDSLNYSIWAMRHYTKLDREIKRIETAYADEVNRLTQWLESETARIAKKQTYFTTILERYARFFYHKEHQKTIKLPDGELRIRKQEPEYEYDDKELLEWITLNYPANTYGFWHDLRKLNWSAIKKYGGIADGHLVDPETGEVIPGVTVTERTEKFTIKLNEEKDNEHISEID